MPELEANGRDEFLQRIADGLPFDEAEKLDILRELAGHLADSTTQLQAEGLTLDEAERTGLDRLGPPERLAAELTQARRTRAGSSQPRERGPGRRPLASSTGTSSPCSSCLRRRS